MSYSLNPEVIERLREAWRATPWEPPPGTRGYPTEHDVTPDAEEWSFVLELAFKASLLADEARPTRPRIAFERNLPNFVFGLESFDQAALRTASPGRCFYPREAESGAGSATGRDLARKARRFRSVWDHGNGPALAFRTTHRSGCYAGRARFTSSSD